MIYDGVIEVAASPREVLGLFGEVQRMASLVPGAFIEKQEEDGAWRGGIVVAFGPKKIRFNGKVWIDLDVQTCSGTIVGRGVGDIRGAKVESRMTLQIVDAAQGGGSPASTVNIHSDITLGGVLADFARTGGVIVANAILREFSARLAAELAREKVDAPTGGAGENHDIGAGQDVRAPASTGSNALRADHLAIALVAHFFRRILQRIRGLWMGSSR